MQKILVIGGSKGIGLEAVKIALEQGFAVRVMARKPEAVGLEHADLELVAGDATDAMAVSDALAGCEAVISAIGIPKSLPALARPTTVFSDATAVLIPAMKAAGITRLLAVTGFGAGESNAAMSTLERLGHKALLGRAYADKAVQEEMIKGSGLDWTIARPGILTNNARTGQYRVLSDPAEWRNGLISRADVGDFLIRALKEGSHIHDAPVLVR
ncbi:NAD-dependent epimerase/dehydratase [Dinoroseobacter shibae DFL 12 = DSM 16493]|jgi:putative NADH-flavin reductase|uniref:NAD-dependent epimerase/dehydratase n=1 Tax=Dinoroseobacter shibae (strain DSM 16493 / NCIMB 14021 / DFL 12) TaxID=398580 RepID=A8LJU9_DINSH|nr:SDR family oxidoreductase [Dinoroseobacter shibae]ABV91775.1 NAD-dependent epimerase/dehydratase [Dinoroseobacter shibae DFL 12 = DSM 16493]URF46757.1 SDR family oxidoreductase [Dinoroseobacter shibae]URF51068.1 SDR family oxidoreductase [Dinoroseobacter shibae]